MTDRPTGCPIDVQQAHARALADCHDAMDVMEDTIRQQRLRIAELEARSNAPNVAVPAPSTTAWVSVPPTKHGWYWWRYAEHGECVPIQLSDSIYIGQSAQWTDSNDEYWFLDEPITGEWYSIPIEPPCKQITITPKDAE